MLTSLSRFLYILLFSSLSITLCYGSSSEDEEEVRSRKVNKQAPKRKAEDPKSDEKQSEEEQAEKKG